MDLHKASPNGGARYVSCYDRCGRKLLRARLLFLFNWILDLSRGHVEALSAAGIAGQREGRANKILNLLQIRIHLLHLLKFLHQNALMYALDARE